ncbi:MAG: cation diffusion facilitator family transporter [Hyphomonadaceae bacterium]
MVDSSQSKLSRGGAVQRVLLLTMALNVLVACSKVAYGHYANVLSVRADGFHSLTDAANNVVGLVGVYLASRPADDNHPYGHAKFELLAAGLVGLSLLGMAYDVLRGAVERFLTGSAEALLEPPVFVVLLVTLAVNTWVARYEKKRGAELESPFLLSDAAHTRSDVLVTAGVLLTVVLMKLGYRQLDGVAAIGIAGFIGWAGIDVLRGNLKHLADARALDPELVRQIATRVPGVASAHKIRTRGAPGVIHVDLHVQIAPHLDVVHAHRVTHWVIDAIKAEIPGVTDVLVHTEPAAEGAPYNPLP